MFDDEIKNWKLEFDFGEDAKKEGESGEPIDFSAQESLGACPKCQGRVFELGSSYVCEHAVGANVICDFKTGKIILQQPVGREQLTKLLATARPTAGDFVPTRRGAVQGLPAFDKKEGKVSFEFQPRAAKAPRPRARRPRFSTSAEPASGACQSGGSRPRPQEGSAPRRQQRKPPPRKRLIAAAQSPRAAGVGAEIKSQGALR